MKPEPKDDNEWNRRNRDRFCVGRSSPAVSYGILVAGVIGLFVGIFATTVEKTPENMRAVNFATSFGLSMFVSSLLSPGLASRLHTPESHSNGKAIACYLLGILLMGCVLAALEHGLFR